MDRPMHSLELHRRVPLRLNAVDWWIYAIVVACTLGAWIISCSSKLDVQQCMRDGAPKLLGILLQAGVLVFAVWAGSEVGRRMKSTVSGFACGTAILLVLTGLQGWLGMLPGRQ
jgi:hypothetical protein